MKQYLLAIDAGTGSVRACLFDLNGNQIGIAGRDWTHIEDKRYPGSMDFDCARNWELTKQTIRQCITSTGVNPEGIIAASAASMREGIVLYDKSNREIFACANVDSRAAGERLILKELNPGLEEEIYAISGQTFSLGAITRLLWIKKYMPDIYESTVRMNLLNDWLTFKLTGVITSEPSNACTTGIFDIKNRRFDNSILLKCGLKNDILPPVIECGAVVSNISKQCAAETGLNEKTLVVQGGGDTQLGGVGIGVIKGQQSAIFGGTFWQFEHNTADAVFDKSCRIRINCHAAPRMWQYEAIAFFAGQVMKWFKNAFGGSYDTMEENAKRIPAGSYGTLCAFSDIMDYINWRHAAPTFSNFGIDPDKYNRDTFFRAIMENAAYVCRGHLDLIKEVTGVNPQGITFAGGGAKSALWAQILADTLNTPVNVPVVKEATSLGAAILAGVGASLYKNIEEACNAVVKIESEYTPNNANAEVYSEIYDKWRTFYKAQLEMADKGITRYMWRG